MLKVGLIGLGAMGQGMARNLEKNGMLDAVYNRSFNKTVEFKVNVYLSIADLAEHVNVILICVSNDQAVLEVATSIAETVKPESIVIDLSTVSSSTSQQIATLLREKKVDFLDAPVTGGVEGANKGTLSMMVGGDFKVLEKVKPILGAFTSRIEHFGAVGSGQACKAVNQVMVAGINQAVTQALAFAELQNLDLNKVIDVLSCGAAGNWFLEHRGKTMIQNIFNPGFKLALHHKDLLICQLMMQHADIDKSLINTTLAEYQQLIAQGFGDEDISALYRLKRKK